MTLRAIAYVRQSKTRPNETTDTSLSLDAQETRIRAYCEAQDWTLVAVHRDSDVVGADPDRPALRAAIDACEAGGIDVLVVFALSRLARDNLLQETIWRRLRAVKVRLVSVTEPHAEDDLVRGILGAVSAAERVRMGKFLSASFRQRADRGLHHGTAPYGYQQQPRPRPGEPQDGYVSLLPNPETAPVVLEMYERYRGGEGSTAICKDLMARTIPARDSPYWHPDAVLRILRNPAYIGVVRLGGTLSPAAWQPIVPRSLWEDVQRQLAQPGRAPRTPYANRSPLQGFIWCGCGARMWMSGTTFKKERKPAIHSFRCASTISPVERSCDQHQRSIGRKRAEALVLAQLQRDLAGRRPVSEIHERALAALNEQAPDRKKHVAELEKRRKSLDARRARVEEWFLSGRRDYAWAAAQGTEIDAEMAAVETELTNVPAAPNRDDLAAMETYLQTLKPLDIRETLLRLRARVEVHNGEVRIVYPERVARHLRAGSSE